MTIHLFEFKWLYLGWYVGEVISYYKEKDSIEVEFQAERGIRYSTMLRTIFPMGG